MSDDTHTNYDATELERQENTTPQPHADDIKLAIAILERCYWHVKGSSAFYTGQCKAMIAEAFQPLRLSNEALRERVKELEGTIADNKQMSDVLISDLQSWQNLEITLEDKLITASEVIEKCEKALLPASWDDLDQAIMREQALAAIKEWKENQ